MTDNHVPGLACAVVIKDKMNWSKAYGMADVGNSIPMSTNGIMNIASISKTITATAVMQLWENGTLSLEEDINVYLPFRIRNPHFPNIPITIKQLLTHTSSITDGSAYGNSYSCEAKEAIINNRIALFPNEKDLTIGEYSATCLYSFPNYPDGLLRTSIVELSYFLTAYMNSGKFNNTKILKQSTIHKMLALQIEGNKSQGLCWHKSEFESLWGHGGSDPGVQTKMYYNPETNIGVIIFQNSNQGDQFEILKKLYMFAVSQI